MKIVETKNHESFMFYKPEANGSQSWYLMRSFEDISFKKFHDVINIKQPTKRSEILQREKSHTRVFRLIFLSDCVKTCEGCKVQQSLLQTKAQPRWEPGNQDWIEMTKARKLVKLTKIEHWGTWSHSAACARLSDGSVSNL